MPGGGRGTIVDIAIALNEDDSSENVNSIKCWIEGGYEVVASTNLIAAAYSICNHDKKLQEIWMYALKHNRIAQEY